MVCQEVLMQMQSNDQYISMPSFATMDLELAEKDQVDPLYQSTLLSMQAPIHLFIILYPLLIFTDL